MSFSKETIIISSVNAYWSNFHIRFNGGVFACVRLQVTKIRRRGDTLKYITVSETNYDLSLELIKIFILKWNKFDKQEVHLRVHRCRHNKYIVIKHNCFHQSDALSLVFPYLYLVRTQFRISLISSSWCWLYVALVKVKWVMSHFSHVAENGQRDF